MFGFALHVVVVYLTAVTQNGVILRLEQTVFPASGQHETLLHVPTTGRYSIRVKSGRGAALELIDRLAGPAWRDGLAGERDGRLDVVLDAGVYKLKVENAPTGAGEAVVSVAAFSEREEPFTLIQPETLVTADLLDLEQRSFWVRVGEKGELRLEAMGRNLADCVLWGPGDWVVSARPTQSIFEPIAGRPMNHFEFHHRLAPGIYKLTCYGGQARAWSAENGENPLYLRLDVPRPGSFGIRSLTVSPFGREAFLIPAGANYFELSRSDKKDTQLTIRPYEEGAPRYGPGRTALIDKDSTRPLCSIEEYANSPFLWMVVRAAPGEAIRVQHFPRLSRTRLRAEGSYLLATQHGLGGRDALDVTAFLSSTDRDLPVRSQTVAVGANNPLLRKTNLMDTLQVFIAITHEGTYRFEELAGSTARANYLIEPFFIQWPRGYRKPPYKSAGEPWLLSEGPHVITLLPQRTGILSFGLIREGEKVGDLAPKTPEEVLQGVFWPRVDLTPDEHYDLWVNERNLVPTGLNLRKLALDLSEPLSLLLEPGRRVPLQIELRQRSHIRVNGGPHQLWLQNQLFSETILPPGIHTLELENTGDGPHAYELRSLPPHGAASAPDNWEDMADSLPLLHSSQPFFSDFQRQTPQLFLLQVDEPGLYRLETSGRMATAVSVRTRTLAELYAGNENGLGRNGLVQDFFKQGTYLVSVRTLGASRGRAGIHLRRTGLNPEATLTPGTLAKATLAPDAAIRYQVPIAEPGPYRIETLGLGKFFQARLEDDRGWPLTRPNQVADFRARLNPGVYYYYSLPDPVAGRRLSSVTPILPETVLEGKGPHPLAFNRETRHIWRQGPADLYHFEVTAPIEAEISLTQGMKGDVFLGEEKLFELKGAQVWLGELAMGSYRVQVMREEEDDHFPYSISPRTEYLVPDVPQPLGVLPARAPISIGEKTWLEMWSTGPTDIKARLIDDRGKVLAATDDSPNDWNIFLSTELEAGRYFLEVDRVGPDYGPVTLHLKNRDVVSLAQLEIPFRTKLVLGRMIPRLPLISREDGLVHLRLETQGEWAMGLAKDGRVLAESGSDIIIPFRAQVPYELLVWQTGATREMDIAVSAAWIPATTVTLNEDAYVLKENKAYQLMDHRGGAFLLTEGADALFSPGVERAAAPLNGNLINLQTGKGWILTGSQTRIAPVTLSPGHSQNFILDGPQLAFTIRAPASTPLMLELETLSPTLGVMAAPAKTGLVTDFHWHGMSQIGNRVMAGLTGAETYRAKIWQTRPSPLPQPFTLNLKTFDPLPKLDMASARQEGSLAPGQSQTLVHDGGSDTWELLLPAGLVAWTHRGGVTLETMTGKAALNHISLDPKGGDLTLANPGDTTARYRVTKPAKPPPQTMMLWDATTGFEQVFEKAGLLKLEIPALAPDRHLFVAGTSLRGELLGANGFRYPIARLPVGPEVAGELAIQHEAGFVKIWQTPLASPDESFLGPRPHETSDELAIGTTPLEGRPQAWTLILAEPSYVILNASQPGVTALWEQHSLLAMKAGISPSERRLTYFLPAGSFQVITRPFRGDLSSGVLDLQIVAPQKLGEDQDQVFLIARGETQVFRFKVTQKGVVGAGVASSGGRLQVTYYQSPFQPLATGPYLLRDCKPGSYLMVVHAPEEAARYQLRILGLKDARTSIPEEVMRQYLLSARELP